MPGVGQAFYGVTSGLSQLGGGVGQFGTGLRDHVQRIGIKGLDAGFGCGVGIGYGFGAGLMLKPSAAEQLARDAQHAAGEPHARTRSTAHATTRNIHSTFHDIQCFHVKMPTNFSAA